MKIFRPKRQGFFKNYLPYALGEIVLVVIGILIALSLNSWKEQQNLKSKELSLYQDLLEELLIDKGEIDGNKDYNERFLARYKRGREIILQDSKREYADSLAVITMALTKYSDFRTNGTAYQKLSQSGKIDLISDNEILNDLQNLGNLYIYIDRLEQTQANVIYEIFPQLSEAIRIYPTEVMDTELLYSYQFHNNIEVIISIGEEKEGLYVKTSTDLQKLIDRLTKKLD